MNDLTKFKLRSVHLLLKRPKGMIDYLLLKLFYKMRLSYVPILPVTIDIEPINICNFKCEHCQVTHWQKPKKELTLMEFQKIIKEFPSLLRVTVQGMGEPLLNSRTIEMLEIVDRQNISSLVFTNGSIMTEKLENGFEKLKNSRLVFSIDAGEKSLFEKIRLKSNFDQITKNIKSITKKTDKPHIIAWTTITKENIKEYRSIIEHTKYLGIDNLVFQTFITDWGEKEIASFIKDIDIDLKDVKTISSSAQKYAKDNGIELNIATDNYLTKENPCPYIWKTIFIDANGDVVPCSVIANSDRLCFGNIFQTSIKEIWNSKKYKNFRKMHRDGNIPKICEKCYD